MNLENTLESVKNKNIIIEIFGLGYVGFPLAIRLSKSNFKIIGIDVNKDRINRLKNEKLLDSEIHLKNEFLEVRKNRKLDLETETIKNQLPKIGIICVPTPIPTEKIKSNIFVKSAVESFLTTAKSGDILIFESSIEVGTTEKMMKIIEQKKFEIGNEIGVCFCPERIDPANKEWGIENIPRVIYCSDDQSYKISKEIYKNVNGGNLIRVSDPKIAEVVKSFENAFRLVNISLSNELAILCDKLGINVKEVIDAASTKPFGFMPHYPGAGAGGHCIPKDPRFLLESAKNFNSEFKTIEHALKINQFMPKYVSESLEEGINNLGLNKILLVCGLSYKANVEDMRDSPSFKIIQEMKRRNFTVYGYDPYFDIKLKEKYLIENHIFELNFELLENIDNESIKNIDCICIVQHHEETKERIQEIYEKSLIPFIYDCQSKLVENSQSNSKLDYLGK